MPGKLKQWGRVGSVAGWGLLMLALPAAGGQDDAAAPAEHWAFRLPVRPNVPVLRQAARVRTPVDAFLLARLEAKGLTFAPDAERRTLARRAYLDLWGLPPAPAAVDAFLADDRPDAFERLLDRLLASPHFGERWGRHWLDVVGYADTVGFDFDFNLIVQPEGKWRYRDYVIAALNRDMPYDAFVLQQLAGDELVDWRHAKTYTPAIREHLIATGFLRNARDESHEPESNIPLIFYGVLHNTVDIVGNSLLGLTLQCARCHDHKFDPISQKEYYQLMAFLTPAYNPKSWLPVYPWKKEIKDRGLPDVSPAERAQIEQHNQKLDHAVKELAKRKAALSPKDRKAGEQLAREIAELQARRRSWGKIQALYDVGAPPATHLLKRGNHETPGRAVEPAFPAALSGNDRTVRIPPEVPAGSSGRRLAFARWITTPDSRAAGLLARVMVNRMWQHLFGEGIVPSPENFGQSGTPPSDPELLEWLSSEFARTGWRVKPMLKLMMTSTAYRQSSCPPSAPPAGADPQKVDPGNRLLWRMRLRRLEAEAIRDSVLAVSGQLDETMGGPPILSTARKDGMVVIDEKRLPTPTAKNRRSVYLLFRRTFNPTLLSVFDQPLVSVNCPRRDSSAVPLQALAMLNDAVVTEQAGHFAARVAQLAGGSREQAIRCAFRLALARPPNAAEERICTLLLERQTRIFREAKASPADAERRALVQLCHTLFNTSEFLYVE